MAAAATNSMEQQQQQQQQQVYTSEDLMRDVDRFRAEGDPFQKIYDCRSDKSDAQFMILDTHLNRFIDVYLLPPLKEKLVKSVDSMNERIVSFQGFLNGPKSAKNDYRSATARFFRRRDGINAAASAVDACMMKLWRQRTCWRDELDRFVHHMSQINKKEPLFWQFSHIKETLTLEEYDRKYITPFIERNPPLRREHVFRLLERIYMARLSWRPKGFYFEWDNKKGRECFAGNENAECVLLLRNYMRQQDGDWLQADVVRAEQLQLTNKEAASEDIDEEYKRSRKEAFLARGYDSDEYGVYDDDEEWME